MTNFPRRRINSYRDLDVWQTAIVLITEVYRVSRRFPPDERFGLTAQVRRAAVSIAANIAEGNARASRGEYRHFVSISRGSSAEVDTEVTVAERLGYLNSEDLDTVREHIDHVGRMLTNLYKSLEERPK